jgi:hypothetical protein
MARRWAAVITLAIRVWQVTPADVKHWLAERLRDVIG